MEYRKNTAISDNSAQKFYKDIGLTQETREAYIDEIQNNAGRFSLTKLQYNRLMDKIAGKLGGSPAKSQLFIADATAPGAADTKLADFIWTNSEFIRSDGNIDENSAAGKLKAVPLTRKDVDTAWEAGIFMGKESFAQIMVVGALQHHIRVTANMAPHASLYPSPAPEASARTPAFNASAEKTLHDLGFDDEQIQRLRSPEARSAVGQLAPSVKSG